MDFGFVDQICLSFDCREIINDTLRAQLCKLIGSQNCYAKFFSISLEYNEDKGEYIKAFHLITSNVINEGIRIQINDNKPNRYGHLNMQWIKTKSALGMKAVLGRITGLRKKNCSIHYATNKWMIIKGDGKARGHRMLNEKNSINRSVDHSC